MRSPSGRGWEKAKNKFADRKKNSNDKRMRNWDKRKRKYTAPTSFDEEERVPLKLILNEKKEEEDRIRREQVQRRAAELQRETEEQQKQKRALEEEERKPREQLEQKRSLLLQTTIRRRWWRLEERERGNALALGRRWFSRRTTEKTIGRWREKKLQRIIPFVDSIINHFSDEDDLPHCSLQMIQCPSSHKSTMKMVPSHKGNEYLDR